MTQAASGPAEQLRLTKMLNAYGRLVEVERKRITTAHDRLLELKDEIERVTDCLHDSDDALEDSVSALELANDRLEAALFGEKETEEVEEETISEDEGMVVTIDPIDETEGTEHVPFVGP